MTERHIKGEEAYVPCLVYRHLQLLMPPPTQVGDAMCGKGGKTSVKYMVMKLKILQVIVCDGVLLLLRKCWLPNENELKQTVSVKHEIPLIM